MDTTAAQNPNPSETSDAAVAIFNRFGDLWARGIAAQDARSPAAAEQAAGITRVKD